MKQKSMFGVKDLPLFSGATVRVSLEPFTPKQHARQQHLGACSICEDTGIVQVRPGPNGKKFCTCEAGDKARKGE